MDRDVEVEDFQRYSEKVHTSLYECPIESSPLFLLHKKGKNSSKPKTSQNKKVKYNAVLASQLPYFPCTQLLTLMLYRILFTTVYKVGYLEYQIFQLISFIASILVSHEIV